MSTRMLSPQLTWSMFLFSVILLWAASSVSAQGSAFSYQGKLNDSGNPATGSYDLQFTLFDTAGAQRGSPVVVPNVMVVNGIFTVQIDFGAVVFNGSPRFLQIGVRPAGSPTPFVDLSPRQPVTATPYALRSATATVADIATNATQLGGLTASGFIQNTTAQQGATDFNIGGTGTAGTLNAGTQFNLGGSRILSIAGTNNLFTGIEAGSANSTGTGNSFFGRSAGLSNLGGSSNSFYGSFAGQNNQVGSSNSFFGFVAGLNNTAGSNSFFGRGAGFTNSSGTRNAFFGTNASDLNTTGSDNSSFGFNAGKSNTTGGSSVFIGTAAGFTNTTGGNITIVGAGSDVTSNSLNFATAIGSGAVVGTSDTVVVGKAAGTYNGIARPADTIQIPGSLSAGILNAATQFNLGGSRILSNAGTNNVFAGIGAGAVNTGSENSFFGRNAGFNNTEGGNNAFFGNTAGGRNTTGTFNSFYGSFAGSFNSTGNFNSFFGISAGNFNTEGSDNSLFGTQAGQGTTIGNYNSFFGRSAGFLNTEGSGNSFFGTDAGQANTTGIFNTIIGAYANVAANNLDHATAIGADAVVSASNSIVLGRTNGAVDKVGIGTSAPVARLEVVGNWTGEEGALRITGDLPTIRFTGGPLADNRSWIIHTGASGPGNLEFYRATGPASWTPVFVLGINSTVKVVTLGAAGGTQLCRNGALEISTCSSSLRYKTAIAPFTSGLELITQLRPITYSWKQGGMRDVGLAAEEVEKIEPLLTTYNDKGEVEGVKYDRLTIALINAIKQQQAQIDSLKKIVCLDHPDAEICKPAK